MEGFTRRNFIGAAFGAFSLAVLPRTASAAAAASAPEHFILERNDWVPNNPRLPVLHYRSAFEGDDSEALAKQMEQRINENGWPAQWRDGVYDYHHYHSTAHEVLGIAGGNASLMLGGPGGRTVDVKHGDVLLLPAGTGHCKVSASKDFLVIGAYPAGQKWDVCTKAPDEAMLRMISELPYPENDPVRGSSPSLVQLWPRG